MCNLFLCHCVFCNFQFLPILSHFCVVLHKVPQVHTQDKVLWDHFGGSLVLAAPAYQHVMTSSFRCTEQTVQTVDSSSCGHVGHSMHRTLSSLSEFMFPVLMRVHWQWTLTFCLGRTSECTCFHHFHC